MPRSPATDEMKAPSRIRAFGAEAAESQVRRRMEAVHRFGADARALARALRLARKAAHGPMGTYDPVGHAALYRLSKAASAVAAARPLFGKS